MYSNFTIDPKILVKKTTDLLNEPVFVRVNKFDDEGVKSFRSDFEKALFTNQNIIPIVVDSFGGQVYSLLEMIDIIKSSKVKVATIATGKAMSCGAVLFSCGAEGYRFMSPYSTLMIHDVSTGAWGKNEEVKADAREADRLNDLIYKLMANNVGKPDKYFWDIVQSKGRADWYLNADDAKYHNLANVIGVPKFEVSVSVDVKFGV